MTTVDVRGLSCPLPVMRAQEAVVDGANEITVLVDSGTAKANVAAQLSDAGYEISIQESGDGWTIVAKQS